MAANAKTKAGANAETVERRDESMAEMVDCCSCAAPSAAYRGEKADDNLKL